MLATQPQDACKVMVVAQISACHMALQTCCEGEWLLICTPQALSGVHYIMDIQNSRKLEPTAVAKCSQLEGKGQVSIVKDQSSHVQGIGVGNLLHTRAMPSPCPD